MVAQLGYEWEETGAVGQLRLHESDRPAFGGRDTVRVALQESAVDAGTESIDLKSGLGSWLLDRLKESGLAVHVRPREQPMAVQDISSRLFSAYRVENGRAHLGGCQLTDFPFLRLSFAAEEEGQPCVRHLFVAYDGTSVSDGQAQDLGLIDVEPIAKSPPRIEENALNALVASGRRIAAKNSSSRDPSASTVEPLLITLVWVKQAVGQLHFTVGDATAALPFSGWAKLIEAQPFVAKGSGASCYHLAATDDGRIDAYDEIATCDLSGRRVLRQELVTCSVTGKHVLEEFTESCPVSGKPALTEQFAPCATCRQRVSKSVLTRDTCTACQKMSKIKKDDPRLVWILGEHGGLDRWKRWQLSETQSVYIAQADRFMKRLLVVVDKETLAIRYLATSSRMSSTWTPIESALQAEYLS